MPTLTQEPKQKLMQPLFIGLQSYTEAQADNFYGRDEEIDRLTNLVKNNTLTIVFGKSGTGKTSLLNAGVFPRLRKDYCLPFRIRLEFQEDSPDLVTQIKKTLSAEIDKYGFKVQAYPSSETLWEYFHREQLWKSVTPILIFDQFEEIFTLGKNGRFVAKDLAEFWEELADLIENSIPDKLKEQFLNKKEDFGFNYKVQKVKTLFSFREEFLPEFESITAKIPSIKYSRFRLMPMNGNQAYEVITKTWMEKIDATQAHKIVGFFAISPDKTQPYELMEIEPSLLSQVCSFIDKERMAQGGKAISAEFLSRYPKELILRSIYNEALTESNAAITGGFVANGNGNGVPMTKKPLNEFVEDKLITDEGYRTKYALTTQEERIKPGIEVLKAKYFVRDDGKSVELTHDVLTPLIKSDREERRKGVAMTVAKRKANKRALFIILFAVAAAAAIWYFTANDAIQAKEKAIKDKSELDLKLKNDSATLLVLAKSLASSKAELDKYKKDIKDKNGNKLPLPGNDSGRINPNTDSMHVSLLSRHLADSIALATLKTERRDLLNTKAVLDSNIGAQKAQIADLTKKLSSASNEAKRTVIYSQQRASRDSGNLASLQRTYNALLKIHNDYIKDVSEGFSDEDIQIEETRADTNSLKLNLYYSQRKNGQGKVPNNLTIYLIPDNSENKSIIRDAKTYEIRCDEKNWENAKGKKTAKYIKGSYAFLDVPPGKYFVKICSYYGGYYSYTKKATGNETAPKWDASPPIR
jgi:hypothetical protein